MLDLLQYCPLCKHHKLPFGYSQQLNQMVCHTCTFHPKLGKKIKKEFLRRAYYRLGKDITEANGVTDSLTIDENRYRFFCETPLQRYLREDREIKDSVEKTGE